MSAPIPWSTILGVAGTAARVLPPPLNIAADVAIEIAKGYLARGCTIEGCPDDVHAVLLAADIPAVGGRVLDARAAAVRKAGGFKS